MSGMPDGLVPARYIGEHAVELRGTVYNLDGTKRKKPSLATGDVFMARDEDVYGKTLWHDPKGIKLPRYVCLGRGVMDEEHNDVPHKDLSEEELKQIGYEYHTGRADFEPLQPLETLGATPKTEATPVGFAVPLDRAIEVPDEEPEKTKTGRKRDS